MIFTPPLFHAQIFYRDGTNSGFFNNEVRPDTEYDKQDYMCSSDSYDDDKMKNAEASVKAGWTASYNLLFNNCQDYVQSVLRAYDGQ